MDVDDPPLVVICGHPDDIHRALHRSHHDALLAGHDWDVADVMAALQPFREDPP